MGSLVQGFELNTHVEEDEGEEDGSYRGGRDTGFDKTRELFGVVIGILLFECRHVVGNMEAEDMLTMNISVELLAVAVVTRKATSAK